MPLMDDMLYIAARNGVCNFSSIRTPSNGRYLLVVGRVSKDIPYQSFLHRTHQGDNIIHIAARYGHEEFVRKATDEFSDLFIQQNLKGETPLHMAAALGHYNIVEYLVNQYSHIVAMEEGALGGQQDPPWKLKNLEDGDTPLHKALRNGHEDVARLLLRKDGKLASYENKVGESPLYLALENHCEEIFQLILTSGNQYQYSVSGPQGQSALHAARKFSEVAMVRVLEERPDLIKRADQKMKTVLHYAVEEGRLSMVKMLLAKDSSQAFVFDEDGLTPLLRAATLGCFPTVKVILDHSPQSAGLSDADKRTALHLAKMGRSLVRFLKLTAILDLINEPDKDGNTPLHLAIKNSDAAKANALLEVKGVNWRVRNNDGCTAMDLCVVGGKVPVKMWAILRRLKDLEANWRPTKMQQDSSLFPFSKEFVRNFFSPKLELRQLLIGQWIPDSRDKATRESIDFLVSMEDLKKMMATIAVVSALIVTITFAAAFTIPGGFSDSGDIILMKRAAVKVFLLSDTTAMISSIGVLFMSMWTIADDFEMLAGLVVASIFVLHFSLAATVVAFISGLYAVTANDSLWVAILVCAMGSFFTLMTMISEVLILCSVLGQLTVVYFFQPLTNAILGIPLDAPSVDSPVTSVVSFLLKGVSNFIYSKGRI
ncbi:hypothetical protein Dimus_002037 [Dionaea muscipula]